MLDTKQFNKIKKALDNGTLKMRILSDEEYKQAEKSWRKAKEIEQKGLLRR